MKCKKILCALLAALTLSTCVPMSVFAAEIPAEETEVIVPAETTETEKSNISGNLVNGGMATVYLDTIYYSNPSDNGCLYSETDGRCVKLTDFGVQYLNVSEDGGIYYTVVDGAEGLTKIGRYDIASGETSVLFAIDLYQGIKNLIVQNGKCYFITNGTVQTLEIATGARETMLGGASNITSFLLFDGGYAYGSVTEDGRTPITVYQYDTMASATITETGSGFDITGEYVYYAEGSDEYCLYRAALNGGDAEKLSHHAVCNIVATEDGIYYKNRNSVESEVLKYDPSSGSAWEEGSGSCTEFAVLPDDQIVTATAAAADVSEIEAQMQNGSRVGRMATGEYRTWKQYDARWASKLVGDGGTMKSIGCLVTSIAICAVDSGVRSEESFDPGILVDMLNNNGGFAPGGNLYWYKVTQVLPEFSINVWNTNLSGLSKEEKNAIIQSHLDAGRQVVVSVRNGGHWVAVDRVLNNDVVIYDPGYNIDLLYVGYAHESLKQLAAFDVQGGSGGNSSSPTEKLEPYRVTVDNLQYRDAPSTSGASMGTLKKGDTVQVVSGYSKSADGYTWYMIQIGGENYYVASGYLEKEKPAATGVALDKTTASVEEGKTVTLKATITPSSADQTVTWSSSNTAVAAVTDDGVVKGIKEGTATITVKTASGKTASCKVTVTKPEVLLKYVTTDYLNYRATASSSGALKGTLKPNTEVDVVEGSSVKANGITWYKIKINGGYYYASSDYLREWTPEIAKVSGFKASSTDTSVTLTWNKVENATGYWVYREKADGGWTKIAAVSNETYTDKDLNAASEYKYAVKAYQTINGKNYYGDYPTVTTVTKPGTVTGLTVTTTTNSAVLKWNAAEGVTGYYVYYRKPGDSVWKKASTTKLTHTFTGLAAHTKYEFAAKGYAVIDGKTYNGEYPVVTATTGSNETLVKHVTTDTLNYRSSPSSSGALKGTLAKGTSVNVVDGYSKTADGIKWYKIKVGSAYYYASSEYLKAAATSTSVEKVTGFKASSTDSSVKLTWNEVEGATGYIVYRAKPSDLNSYVKLKTQSGLTYTDSDLAAGSKYKYAVKAYKTINGKNYYGEYPTVTTVTKPGTVTGLTVTTSTNSAVLKWNAAEGVTGYYVYYRKPGDSVWKKAGTTKLTHTFTGLAAHTKYEFAAKGYAVIDGKTYNGEYPVVTATTESNETLVKYVTTDTLNYRSSPSSSGALKGTLAKGASVDVVDGYSKTADGIKWYKIKVGSTYYYASSEYLKAAATSTSVEKVTGFKASSTDSSVKLTWNEVEGATGYIVYRAKPSDLNSYVKLKTQSGLTYTDSDLAAGSKYKYAVKAYKTINGKNYYGEYPTVTTVTKPGTVTGLTVTTTTNSAVLKWNAAEGVTGYYVYYRKPGDSVWKKASTTKLTHTFTGLAAHTKYEFAAKGYKVIDGTTYNGEYPVVTATTGSTGATEKLVKYTTTDSLNYRSSPSTSGTLKGTLAKGASVNVVDGYSKTADGIKWNKIKIGSAYYYVSSEYLKKA